MNPATETREIEQFAEIIRAAFPGDDELLADMLEGETDLHSIVGRLLIAEAEAEAQSAANKDLASTYVKRANAAVARSQALRGALQRVVEATGLRKVAHEFGTVSLRHVKSRPVFDGDAADLPDDLRSVKYSANMKAIGAALDAGETVAGVHMTNGGETISIRRA